MSFLHPEFLYYMLPPLFILFGLLLTQKEVQATYFSDEVMEKLRVSANTLTLKARNALFFLMGVLIVVALAGPVINNGKVEVKAKSSDIMIALDISDSMLGEDVYPNRLKLAKQKALELLKIAPDERIGVIAFAKNSYLVSPLSFDHSVVSFLLKQLNTDSITEKGTDFFSMLEVVNQSLKKESKKYLLILSDGGDSEDFSKEISYAKEHNITVFVLGIGTTKGAPIKKANGEFVKYKGEVIVSKLNENISEFATATGGVYIQNVNSNEDIKAMYKEIAAHAVKKELKSQEITKFIPLFYYPLGLALLLLLIATSSMSKREVIHVPSLLLVSLLLGVTQNAEAGVLDFMKLDDAKKAYESGEYAKSKEIYSEYAKSTKNSEVNYNVGNSLYKEGKYKEAVNAYKKATFDDTTKRAKNFSNLGNAYVKSGEKDALKKAIDSYEKSLKIQEDKETRENLEAVKKYLEEQKKKEDKKKKDQKNKDKKNDKKDKSDKNKENQEKDKNKKDKSDKKDKKSDEKSQDKKEKSDKSDKKGDKSQNKDDKKSEQQKKKEEQQKNKKEKSQEQKKKDAAKEIKDEQEKDKKAQSAAQPKDMKDKMSDEEEKKWLKGLNKRQSTFLYRLNKNNKYEENSDAKPW